MNNHQLLHTLWTKAVGTPDYDKRQWEELEAKLKQTEKVADGQLIEALFPDKSSIRDQFAMAAMSALEGWMRDIIETYPEMAKRCYIMADSMLEARKK